MKSNAVIASQNTLCGVSSCLQHNHRTIFTHAAVRADTSHRTKRNGSESGRGERRATDWDTEPSEKYLWWVTIVILCSSSLLQKCENCFFPCIAQFGSFILGCKSAAHFAFFVLIFFSNVSLFGVYLVYAAAEKPYFSFSGCCYYSARNFRNG